MKWFDLSTSTGYRHLIFVSWAVLALFVLLAPREVAQAAWARAFTDWMASFIPMIDKAGGISFEGQFARFSFALAWLLTPLDGALLVRGIERRYREGDLKVGWLFAFMSLLMCIAGAWFLWAFPINADSLNPRERVATQTRIGIAIYGTVLVKAFFSWVAVLNVLILMSRDRLSHPEGRSS